MKYFRLKQSTNAINYAKIPKNENDLFAHRTPLIIPIQYASIQKHIYYLPFIETPVFTVSEKLKLLFENYQIGLQFRPVALQDLQRQQIEVHWFMKATPVNCLSKNTEFYKDKALKKPILNQKKINENMVFELGGIREKRLIVSLQVVESMLQMGINEVAFEPVDCMGE